MSTVLVTGGTGFIGRHLVPTLVRRGFDVRVAIRNAADETAFGEDVTPFVIGDLAGEVDSRSLLKGTSAVVHLAGLAHISSSISDDTIDATNRRAPVHLARAARDAGARFIFMSSVRAQVGPSASETVTEDAQPEPTDRYGKAKLAAEQGIAEIGGDYVILRPALVYGPGVKGNMHLLQRLAKLPAPLPFAGIQNARSILAIENLIEAVVLALQSSAVAGGTFLIADETPISLPRMIAALRHDMSRGPGLFRVPEPMLKACFTLAGQSPAWERLAGSLVVSTERIRTAGYRPIISTEAALAALGRS